MKKRLFASLALLLVLALLGTLVACGPSDNGDPAGTDGETTASGAPATDGETTAAPPMTGGETQEDSEPVTDGETTEEDQPVVESPIYQHVVLVGVDGAGAFFREADTPNLDRIFADGAVTYEGITSTPSISAQSWGSLFHGVTPEFHRLDNTVTSYRPYPSDSEFPSFLRVIREQMPEASLASICHWNNINIGVIEDGIGVYKDADSSDAGVVRKACDYVEDQVESGKGAPTVLFLQLDEADAAGHGSGYGTPTHLKTIKQLDRLINMLYNTYDEQGLLDETLFIVTTDHGGLGTSHGGDSDAEMKIMFAATGKTVEKGTIGEMGIRDTASIVLHALGLSEHQPAGWTSRVPSGLFKGVVAGERPVYTIPETDRTHENQPTPEAGSAGHITNFITDKSLTHYLTMDGDITDECGAATTKEGNLYFVADGYFGQGVSLNDGYISIPDYAPGTDSFSVSMWVKTTGVSSDPSLFSNKDWNNGALEGYVLSIRSSNDIKFNLGDGESRVDLEKLLPSNYQSGWMHVLLVVDRTAEEIRLAVDFGKFTSASLPAGMKGVSFDGYDVLNIGQDGTGNYGASLAATVDEFMVFDGALTADDVAALAEYYGK